MMSDGFCGGCGEPCRGEWQDMGHNMRFREKMEWRSNCCSFPIYADENLTVPADAKSDR